ncbi:MAG: molecular chaperone DnaJ [Candidatus Kariarchaeaceae archaeon]|jgi:molecular chaperone DnaJ
MSKKRDYYEVLGVQKGATEKEMKRAYRKKAMQFHPDKYEGPKQEGEVKFKELNEAYSILSDSQQRTMYDRFGHEGVGAAGSTARSADPFDFFSSIFDFDLGSFFGGSSFGSRTRQQRQRRGPTRGEDVVLDLELSFEEAYSGVTKKVKMPFRKACSNCQGSGGEPNTTMERCNKCNGVGMVEHRQSQGFFVQISREPCRHCQARGEVPKQKCKECKGSGRSDTREQITVPIPKGIDDRQAVRVQGKGKPSSNGGMPGDLIFRIHLKEHKLFERNGLDVYQRIFVDYPTMVLGGSMEVPVLSSPDEQETANIKIPSGTQLNDVLNLKKKGFTRKVSGGMNTGNAHFVVSLKVPKKVSKRQKELLKELQEAMN